MRLRHAIQTPLETTVMNVVHINTHPARLRPGEMAIHDEYGWVEIVERTGSRRKIRWIEHRPVPSEARRPDELDAELLTVWEDWVDGDTLKATSGRKAEPMPSSRISLLVLAIPSKRFTRNLVSFLARAEVDALLAAPDQRTWSGRRDHAFLLVAVQTGLRLSEMTGLKRDDLILGAGAHVRVVGKGRKERCTPLAKSTLAVLKAWLREPQRGDGDVLFPSAKGERLSVHGVQYLLNKHRLAASQACPSLKQKRITVHRLRHTMAMDLLQAGVDRSVIALWLGHESVETTQIYLEANLEMKEQALAKTAPPNGTPGRYKPGDQLLNFLNSL